MSSYPTDDTPIKTVGFSEFCEVNGQGFKRKKGARQWDKVSPEGSSEEMSESSPLRLSLVQEEQAPGEPRHWSLFIAREGQKGMEYQVTGDAEFMTYQPSDQPVDVLASETFYTMYNLATVTEQQAETVKQVAEQEPPPQAPSRQAVTENCQGWVVRVLAKLVGEGIVENSKVEMARSMVQPV